MCLEAPGVEMKRFCGGGVRRPVGKGRMAGACGAAGEGGEVRQCLSSVRT